MSLTTFITGLNQISLVIGIFIGALIFIFLYLIVKKFEKRTSLKELRQMVNNAHNALQAANEELRKIYLVLNEVEENLG